MIILSIDGGASQTRGTIFTTTGDIRVFSTTGPTSLSGGPTVLSILAKFIQDVAEEADLEMTDVGLVALGLAGISDADARDQLFKSMAGIGITDKLVVTSDAEAAYETVFADRAGVLVSVGTGAIGWARDEQGNSYRASGRGPKMGGDPGSGYWLGKTLMIKLIMTEAETGPDLDTMRQKVIDYYDADDFEDAARKAGEVADQYHVVAGLAIYVCEEAAKGNELALAILQEGTMALAEDLLPMFERSGMKADDMLLGINGSIIVKNELYRTLLAEAMIYDIPEVSWLNSALDPVFGAGLLGARMRSESIDMSALIENWEAFVVSTNR